MWDPPTCVSVDKAAFLIRHTQTAVYSSTAHIHTVLHGACNHPIPDTVSRQPYSDTVSRHCVQSQSPDSSVHISEVTTSLCSWNSRHCFREVASFSLERWLYCITNVHRRHSLIQYTCACVWQGSLWEVPKSIIWCSRGCK